MFTDSGLVKVVKIEKTTKSIVNFFILRKLGFRRPVLDPFCDGSLCEAGGRSPSLLFRDLKTLRPCVLARFAPSPIPIHRMMPQAGLRPIGRRRTIRRRVWP